MDKFRTAGKMLYRFLIFCWLLRLFGDVAALSAADIAAKRPKCTQDCYHSVVPKYCPMDDFHCQCQTDAGLAIYKALLPCFKASTCSKTELEQARGLTQKMCRLYNSRHPISNGTNPQAGGPPSGNATHSGGSTSIDAGEAAGIAVGATAVIVFVVGLLYYLWRRWQRRKWQKHLQAQREELGGGEDKEAWGNVMTSKASHRFPRELHGNHRPIQLGGESIYEMPPGLDAMHELPGFRSPTSGTMTGSMTPKSYRSYGMSFRRMSI